MRRAPTVFAISLFIAAALPLTINPWGYNAFELPKVILLRGVVLLGGLAMLIQATGRRNGLKPGYSGRRDFPLLGPVALLGLILVLATLFSVNRQLSVWGSYQRQQGLLTWGTYLGLFVLTAASLRTRRQIRRLWLVLAWSSAPVIFYGLLQAAGLDPFTWRSDGVSPVLSTLGRANFLGSYLVLILPLTFYLLCSNARRWPAILLLAGQLTCLALTQARGAWFGFGAAVLTFGALWAVVNRRRRLLAAMLAATVLSLALLGALNIPGGPLAPLTALPGIDRLSRLSDINAGSTAARVAIWRATWPLIAARPWLGYGPDTMQAVFDRVFPPQLVYYQGRQLAVDRTHNLWLDLGMTAGVAGAAAFGLLLLNFGWLARRELQRTTDSRLQLGWIALASAAVGHLADLQFSFTVTATAAVFWLILALAAGMYRVERFRRQPDLSFDHQPQPDSAASRGQKISYGLAALLTLALLVLLCVRPLLADSAFWKSQNGQFSAAARRAAGLQAVRLLPMEAEYRLGLALIEQRQNDFSGAEAQLDAASQLIPNTPRLWAARGNLYARWGALAPSRYRQAEAAYRRAVALAPNKAAYHTALGLILARQGNYEAGVAAIERAVELDATDVTAYNHLAELYLAQGRKADAAWATSQAVYWAQKTGAGDK